MREGKEEKEKIGGKERRKGEDRREGKEEKEKI